MATITNLRLIHFFTKNYDRFKHLEFNPEDQEEKEHMLEHLRDTIGDKDTSEMTPEELQFYYFKQHDYDNNNMLDGIELIQGILFTYNYIIAFNL